MKRLATRLALLLAAILVGHAVLAGHAAQARTIEQGAVSVGGGLDVTMTSDSDSGNATHTSGTLRLGYFPVDNLELGGQARVRVSSYDEATASNYSLGPYATLHIPLLEQLNAILFASAGFGWGEIDRDNAEDSNITVTSLAGGGGLAWFLSRNTAAHYTLTVSHERTEYNPGSRERDTTDLTHAVGISVYF